MGGTIFKRHISALEPPWWYIISPPFTAVPDYPEGHENVNYIKYLPGPSQT
jgi:hypothetical protein